MLFIEYPKCSTYQKAKHFLEEHQMNFQDRNIVTETPTIKELQEWTEKYNIDLGKLYNTSGMKYREQNLKEKRLTLSKEEQIKLLSSDGMLIKRPLLITDNQMLIGFKEKEWKKLIEEE